MASKIVRWLRDIGEHGVHSKYLQGDFWQSLLGVFGNIGAEYLGTGLSDSQIAMNQFEHNEAEETRKFEKEMSDTSYQRGVADMQKAGLNPALMYGSGSGASTPNGAQASAVAAPSKDILGLLADMTMKNRELQFQKDITNRELAIQNMKRNDDFNLRVRELNLRRDALEYEKSMRGKEFELKDASTKKLIEVYDQQIAKLAEETKSETARKELFEAQERLTNADASVKESFAEKARDFYDAQVKLLSAQESEARSAASLHYKQAAVLAIEEAYKNKLYTDDFISAQISDALNKAKFGEGKLDLQSYEIAQADWNSYVEFVKSCVIRGNVPGKFDIKIRKGKNGNWETRTIPPLDDKTVNNLMKSLGYLPTSEGESYMFGEHWSPSYSYGSSWTD